MEPAIDGKKRKRIDHFPSKWWPVTIASGSTTRVAAKKAPAESSCTWRPCFWQQWSGALQQKTNLYNYRSNIYIYIYIHTHTVIICILMYDCKLWLWFFTTIVMFIIIIAYDCYDNLCVLRFMPNTINGWFHHLPPGLFLNCRYLGKPETLVECISDLFFLMAPWEWVGLESPCSSIYRCLKHQIHR